MGSVLEVGRRNARREESANRKEDGFTTEDTEGTERESAKRKMFVIGLIV
jgi:hypothetical protein